MTRDLRILKEKVEVLNGDRGNRDMAAMRRGEAKDLRAFIAQAKAGTSEVQKAVDALNQQAQDIQQALNDAQELLDEVEDEINGLREDLDQGLSGVEQQLNGIQSAVGGVPIPTQQSEFVISAPTSGDHNALVQDVQDILSAIANIQSAISD